MYQILCDGFPLYDPRDDELIVTNPKCKLEVNTVGEASFSIFATHPYYDKMEKLKSVIEILQDSRAIFRGRLTDDTSDFENVKNADIEGAMAYLNDSYVKPFIFPDDFLKNAEYIAESDGGNVVRFFLKWLLDNHNNQVQEWQKLKLGNVTVADANNVLSRSIEERMKTWEVVKTRLFESALGGYLCIRYEADGNYIDYLAEFTETNPQKIVFGENLLDILKESDATTTYSAVVPLGKKKSEIDKNSKDESRLTIESLADGAVSGDIVKKGEILYSKTALEKYGFIVAPIAETTWDDVTKASNLRTKGVNYLKNQGTKLMNTITVKAVDLYFSDDEIETFRLYKNIKVESLPHNLDELYRLTVLDIDILNPQNTVITLGDTRLSMTDINASNKKETDSKIETALKNTGSTVSTIGTMTATDDGAGNVTISLLYS